MSEEEARQYLQQLADSTSEREVAKLADVDRGAFKRFLTGAPVSPRNRTQAVQFATQHRLEARLLLEPIPPTAGRAYSESDIELLKTKAGIAAQQLEVARREVNGLIALLDTLGTRSTRIMLEAEPSDRDGEDYARLHAIASNAIRATLQREMSDQAPPASGQATGR